MKRSKWIRFLALALLLAMAVGAIPAAMATEDSAVEQTVPDSVSDEPLEVEPEAAASVSPEPEPKPSEQPPAAEEAQKETEEPAEDQEPTDMNGETLTRHAMTTGGLRRARSAAYGTVSKSTCVEFSGYTSPYWYCNRYSTVGSHVYGHYYYAATIAYHISRETDEPIPGLYASGNCSGERFPIMYTTPVAGVSIGIACTLGRIVGDYVARHK